MSKTTSEKINSRSTHSSTCALKKLSVEGFRLSYERVFEALRTNTTLRQLGIGYCVDVASIERVAFSIEQVVASIEQLKSLAAVLQDNTYLHSAIVNDIYLNEDDTTSPEHRLAMERRPIKTEIKYLLGLNRLGRGKVRDPNTTVREFVDILGRALATKFGGSSAYGLLRENPKLWIVGCDDGALSVRESQRKRKRDYNLEKVSE